MHLRPRIRLPRPAGATTLTFLALSLFLAGITAQAATNDPLLTVARIFDSGEFRSEGYGSITWRASGAGYYKLEGGRGGGRDLVRIDPATGAKEIIVPASAFVTPGEGSSLPVESYQFSRDESKLLILSNSKRVWRQNNRGDYWVLDVTSRELRKLGGDAAASTLQFAKFSPDASKVAFVRENNLYVQALSDLTIKQLTSDGSSKLINGTFDWVYEEELSLRDGFRWSPDGRSIAYWQLDTTGVREFYLINNTEGLYPKITAFPYPKAGEQNSAARVGVVSVEGGETRWLNVPGDPRNHYIAQMDWASNSTQVVLQQFNRLQNTNLVFLADAQTGDAKVILTETDAAWVDNENDFRWINRGKELVWISERSGWRQVYRASRDGKSLRKITSGNFDVISISRIDDQDGWLYYIASPKNATQRYLYRVSLQGFGNQRLSPVKQAGTHSYNISPDARWAIHSFSTSEVPPVTELVSLPDHKVVRVLEDNQRLRTKLEPLSRPGHEFFRVTLTNHVTLDGYCLTPPNFDASRKYPVLFYVYGEPGGQTVLDSWRDRSGLWHWMLAQQGYIVMSVDNRGTPAPRGREWRKCIYGRVGILNAADQAGAVRALLQSRPYLDPDRVGIWGWSGGGSSTLNAMLQYPEVYKTGMAVAAVANWRYYDTIYEERYMGLPQDNPEGYRLGSPVTHASALRGNLLIVHGTGDDNVHYQGAEAMANELILHNKPFTLMPYPNRSHGISEGANTTRHLFELLTHYLQQNLPPGAREGDPAPVVQKRTKKPRR